MLDAGEVFDELLDRLHDAGFPPPRFGRTGREVWLNVTLPDGKGSRRTVERRGQTLDVAARRILDLDMTCADRERDAALESS